MVTEYELTSMAYLQEEGLLLAQYINYWFPYNHIIDFIKWYKNQ